MRLTSTQFLVFGFVLVTFGMVMPFLMVMRIIESTLFLSFASYAASITGLLFGIIGVASYAHKYRNSKRDHDR